MFKLEFSPEFYTDIEGAKGYISNDLCNPTAANHLLKNVESVLKRIKDNPFIYPVYHNGKIAANNYRFAVISKYILLYTVDEVAKTVRASRFIYGGRNIPNMI